MASSRAALASQTSAQAVRAKRSFRRSLPPRGAHLCRQEAITQGFRSRPAHASAQRGQLVALRAQLACIKLRNTWVSETLLRPDTLFAGMCMQAAAIRKPIAHVHEELARSQ